MRQIPGAGQYLPYTNQVPIQPPQIAVNGQPLDSASRHHYSLPIASSATLNRLDIVTGNTDMVGELNRNLHANTTYHVDQCLPRTPSTQPGSSYASSPILSGGSPDLSAMDTLYSPGLSLVSSQAQNDSGTFENFNGGLPSHQGVWQPSRDSLPRLDTHVCVQSQLPSAESDGFTFINADCSQCTQCQDKNSQLRVLNDQRQQLESRVNFLEGEKQDMMQQLRGYEDLIRQQQATLKSSLEFNSSLEQKLRAKAGKQVKKRELPASHGETADKSASSKHPNETGKSSSKRFKLEPDRREQTAETRRNGACIRCWKHRQRCEAGDDPEAPCRSCRQPSLSLVRIPCIRTHIVDISLFRTKNGDNDTWTTRDEVTRLMDLTTYCSKPIKIQLSQGCGVPMIVEVTRYKPVRGDEMAYTLQDKLGNEYVKRMPPYALSNIENLKNSLQMHAETNQDDYLERFLYKQDVPTWEAFRIARKWAGKSQLLHDALQFWTAARFIETPWQIHGNETLGIERDNHMTWTAITPIMDTQLDQVVMKSILQPLRQKVLRKLQTKIERERNSCFEVFICIIILLHSVEKAIRHDHEFAAFFGHEYSPGRTRFEDYDLVEHYFHAAITLLAHVKIAVDARFPFMDTETDISKLMNACRGDDDEKDFVNNVDQYLHSSPRLKLAFDNLRRNNEYESNQFFVHQLFLKDWDGKPIHIVEKQPQTQPRANLQSA